MYTLANILTLSRLLMLPLIILMMFIQAPWAVWTTLILYIAGALTDWFDGWAARRYNQVSPLGTFLDPISDKIFVVCMMLMLIATDRIGGALVLAVIIILIREFLIAGLREFLGPKDVKLPVTKLAKWKTTFQMIAIGLLIMTPVSNAAAIMGDITLSIAAILTAVTGYIYLKASWQYLR